jgi:hypothetical protein
VKERIAMESSTKEARLTRKPLQTFPCHQSGSFSDNQNSLPTAAPGSWKILYSAKKSPLDPNGPRETTNRGFQSSARPVSGTTLRIRSETFSNRYSQTRLFYACELLIINRVPLAIMVPSRIVWLFQGLRPQNPLNTNPSQ